MTQLTTFSSTHPQIANAIAPRFAAIVAFTMWLLVGTTPVANAQVAHFEDPADYPLMGNWIGELHDPPGPINGPAPLAAQLVLLNRDRYRVVILPKLHRRARPYLTTEVSVTAGAPVQVDYQGWNIEFRLDGTAEGTGTLHGKEVALHLKKTAVLSPTLGAAPPTGAVVLFNGTTLDGWKHDDGRDCTWELTDADGEKVIQTVSKHWHGRTNEKKGRGGSLKFDRPFPKDCRLHLEFRYPVEPGRRGQGLGNSSLLLGAGGHIQVLNSFGEQGLWDDAGSFYKEMPPQVNAAAPPLQWQTYDVEVDLPENPSVDDRALITLRLNGILIHNRHERHVGNGFVTVRLEDHINRMQFRNIWITQ